ncbi:uncharacterized protein [Ambystoma mexicanum]|uniref:uncharacterized protein n=1 Tax=Ambystoma mexicanum TaxID=8296 RepID=UPI0037E7D2CB
MGVPAAEWEFRGSACVMDVRVSTLKLRMRTLGLNCFLHSLRKCSPLALLGLSAFRFSVAFSSLINAGLPISGSPLFTGCLLLVPLHSSVLITFALLSLHACLPLSFQCFLPLWSVVVSSLYIPSLQWLSHSPFCDCQPFSGRLLCHDCLSPLSLVLFLVSSFIIASVPFPFSFLLSSFIIACLLPFSFVVSSFIIACLPFPLFISYLLFHHCLSPLSFFISCLLFHHCLFLLSLFISCLLFHHCLSPLSFFISCLLFHHCLSPVSLFISCLLFHHCLSPVPLFISCLLFHHCLSPLCLFIACLLFHHCLSPLSLFIACLLFHHCLSPLLVATSSLSPPLF